MKRMKGKKYGLNIVVTSATNLLQVICNNFLVPYYTKLVYPLTISIIIKNNNFKSYNNNNNMSFV